MSELKLGERSLVVRRGGLLGMTILFLRGLQVQPAPVRIVS
jgi:hypothetical protein